MKLYRYVDGELTVKDVGSTQLDHVFVKSREKGGFFKIQSKLMETVTGPYYSSGYLSEKDARREYIELMKLDILDYQEEIEGLKEDIKLAQKSLRNNKRLIASLLKKGKRK